MVACSLISEYFFPPLLRGDKSEYFDIEVYDGKTTNPKNLLLSTKSDNYSSSVQACKPKYELKYQERFAGRDYTVKFFSTPEFEAKDNNILPLIISGTGILIGILSGGIVGFQVRSRKQAHELLEKIKKSDEELQRTNEQLENQIKKRQSC
jgi:hypothetical protein